MIVIINSYLRLYLISVAHEFVSYIPVCLKEACQLSLFSADTDLICGFVHVHETVGTIHCCFVYGSLVISTCMLCFGAYQLSTLEETWVYNRRKTHTMPCFFHFSVSFPKTPGFSQAFQPHVLRSCSPHSTNVAACWQNTSLAGKSCYYLTCRAVLFWQF